ncbi:MAG: hypothetical protein ABFR75_06215 [Acidobacteriota bacterium]
MIFKSHFISMIVFSGIISTMIAFIRHDEKDKIKKTGIKLFLYMAGGVIAASWIMNFI